MRNFYFNGCVTRPLKRFMSLGSLKPRIEWYRVKNYDRIYLCKATVQNQRTEGPESRTDGETLIFWE